MDNSNDFDYGDLAFQDRPRARATRFSGDYSKLTVAEDTDLGEEEEATVSSSTAPKTAISSSSRGRPSMGEGGSRPRSSTGSSKRVKECSGCGEMVATSAKVCTMCDYQFTAKSISQLNASFLQNASDESESVRDMFPFEPEREEDGSLLITAVLGRRLVAREDSQSSKWYRSSGAIAGLSALEGRYEHEYLVKFKGLSYRRVQWLSATDIEAMNLKARQTLLRYINKLDKGEPSTEDTAEFEPCFLEVERVLDYREEEVLETVNEQPGTRGAAEGRPDTAFQEEEEEEEEEEEVLVVKKGSGKSKQRAAPCSVHRDDEEPRAEVSKVRVFRAEERCRHILERLSTDEYSRHFIEDVDLDAYPDYVDAVERPMSLGSVRLQLEAGEYAKSGKHRAFANDMRLIFSNCKKYNLYKSHIWHAAHTLSLLFERLYQAWCTSFQDGAVPFEDLAAQPWEPSCRGCAGVADEGRMILCDHCDAYYHLYCVQPKLKSTPEGAWMCNRCSSFFEKNNHASATSGTKKRVKVYSASAEDDARRLCAGAGEIKLVSILKKKYLVKWRGLPYRECTWESADSICDDDRVREYHRLNDDIPDEPTWSAAEISAELCRSFRNPPAIKAPHLLHDLEANIHAQMRSYHFLRFDQNPSAALLRESGPAAHSWAVAGTAAMAALPQSLARRMDDLKSSKSSSDAISSTWRDPIRDEVAAHLSSAIHCVARGLQPEMYEPYPARARLPSRDEGPASEIEVCIRKGFASLGVRVAMFRGYPVICSFCVSVDNKKFHIETTKRVKQGDIIVAVDGIYVHLMPYASVLTLLRSDTRPFMYLRLLRCPSVLGRNLSVQQAYFREIRSLPAESIRPSPQRSAFFGVYPCASGWAAGAYGPDLLYVDAGSFNDEVDAARAYDDAARRMGRQDRMNFSTDGLLTREAAALGRVVLAERSLNDSKALEQERLLRDRADGAGAASMCDIASIDSQDSESDDDEGEGEGAAITSSNSRKIRTADEGYYQKIMRAIEETRVPPEAVDWDQHIVQFGYGRGDKKKRWEQIDLVSGQVISVWDSVASAARHVGMSSNSLYACLSGRTDNAGGFKWAIQEDAGASRRHEDSRADREERPDGWQHRLHSSSKEYKSGGTLRDYQVDGLNWLLRCWYNRRGSILADEMGLGKTLQVISFLDHLFTEEGLKGHFLVCVPLSTIEHWRREAESWSHMNVCVYHDIGGGKDTRDIIREYEWYYKGRSRRLLKFHLLITTYDDLIRDYEALAEVPWKVVVIDEAHRLKGSHSKLADCIKEVLARGAAQGYQHRLLMTGTPLQNNTSELFQLLNFIEPAKFADVERFTARFGDIKTQEQVEALQKRIAPHLLRRVKEDVAKDIPPKEETIIDVELTTMQKQYYRAIFERNHGFLMQSLKSSGMPKLMNIQMELRKCCNHPFLINGVEITEMEAVEGRMLTDPTKSSSGSSSNNNNIKEFRRRRLEEALIPSSGKMVLIDKLLPKLRKEGHKVLIFSQMVKMIDIIEEYCDFRKYPCERLDGRVSGNDRQKSIDRFNKDPNSFVFLLSTRAGGVGINLTAADTVIIFDSDWNPQNDVQAMARCHRIGQSKSVTVYRLITRRSFEAEMFERASKKLGLEQALLGSRQFDVVGEEDAAEGSKRDKMDAKELEQLLREGAYSLLLEEGDAEAIEFYQQDIDSILAQRAHTIVSEGGQQTEGWLNKKKALSKARVSKSKFTGDSSMQHAEIDVNDPDFWKKVLPDLVTPDMMLARLDDECYDDTRVEKYFSDLQQMMGGMLDLHRKSQLPDRERTICMQLLLSITLREDDFDDIIRFQAQEWLSLLEGTRARKNRQELLPARGYNRGGDKGKKKDTVLVRSIFVRTPGKKGRPSKVFIDENGEPIAKVPKKAPEVGEVRKRGRPKKQEEEEQEQEDQEEEPIRKVKK